MRKVVHYVFIACVWVLIIAVLGLVLSALSPIWGTAAVDAEDSIRKFSAMILLGVAGIGTTILIDKYLEGNS